MDLPEVGDQVPRRQDPRTQKLGIQILRHSGWQIMGNVPNLPRVVVIGAPHTSNWDGVVAMSLIQALQIRINIMGKDSLFKYPVAREFLRWLGIFPIDRSSPQGVVEQTVERMQAAPQMWLGLSPEGTRKKASKWKNGFYRIAQLAEVPILMVALDFGRRQIRFAPLFEPSGDFDLDMRHILGFFSDAAPCRPEMLSAPLVKYRHAQNLLKQ
ncbi:MAG: lysophospholipid acyltransferase family protein [Salinisphaeraceae bacterium]|nr:lysophospholipid acyltransferase family protein [Salinisphaeraceae bacterium]